MKFYITIKSCCCQNKINCRSFLQPKTLSLCCQNHSCTKGCFCQILPKLSHFFPKDCKICMLFRQLPSLHHDYMCKIGNKRRNRLKTLLSKFLPLRIRPKYRYEAICLGDNPRVEAAICLCWLQLTGNSL